ncbi:toll/interleukin-1 receptor (TIR) domain-containing protein [Artemisia annua]|uniref:Toll/interleukin-1 receptor (TIR) domain-containing protein n=1 Tax=Artemisia annua TaxID=35608 RepID=A0A2U1L8W5_ARTAN|nr:toll/interleukin-1 receptor (TIR) domain-containing protein [Artemisia annua]
MASSSNSSAPEIMVSTSTSSIQKRFKYDVFLSFRGEDTRKNFVDHLYHALKDKGIYTYKDDEKIQKGKRISDDLFKSIEDSKFYIIVFSKNYASSSWCLDELVKIMECHKMTEHTAYPVFYDVEPTEVHKQSGAVGEAFAKHENEEAAGKWREALKEAADLAAFAKHENEEAAGKWREALKEAADLAGWELKNTLDGHEAKFIKKVVQEISLELRSINIGFDEKLVGMDTRVRDVISSLEVGIDEVRMIGIKGMGGAGKTTTTRSVFDHLSNDFEAKSFVENVREVSTILGLKKLLEQVLSDVLKEDVTVNGVTDGKNMMKERMCGKKVLLVLDDVDHIDQLEALASGPNWFKPGSRIIITTRDEQVLVAHKVHLIRDINLLSDKEAICLLSRYAFGREIPSQGYEELSLKVVRYAAGLPLTVKVLGSFLCGKDMVEWEDAIERLKKIPLKETQEKLELSYMSLEDEYKEIFLDIACILKGQIKEAAIRILESCGFHARNGLKVLERRSLVTFSSNYDSIFNKYDQVLGMHDHIEEMGKNIVRREHPDEPNKHSRLWIEAEIKDILANDKGTEETSCLELDSSYANLKNLMKGLGKMKNLRYLEMNFANYGSSQLDESTQYFPNSLKYLKFTNYPFLYLPKTFQANNLVGLDMHCYYSFGLDMEDRRMVQLWDMEDTRMVQLWDMEDTRMVQLWDMEDTRMVQLWDMEDTRMVQLWDMEDTRMVQLWDMEDTRMVQLWDMEDTRMVQLWDMEDTRMVQLWDMEDTRMVQLWDMEDTRMVQLWDMEDTRMVQLWDMEDTRMVQLWDMEDTRMVQLWDMEDTRMVQLWEDGEEKVLKKLKFLYLSWSKLVTFDFRITPNLKTLSLNYSFNLKELCMPDSCQKLNYLEISHSKLETFDLGLTPNLVTLRLQGCNYVEKLHLPVACPNLKFLNLSESRLRSLDLELIPNLERLDLENCGELVEINTPVGCLEKLVYLNLSGCALLEKLPEDIGQSECLEELDITYTGISHLPQSIFEMKGLIIAARQELLELYDFPSEIETTIDPIG